MLCRLGVEEHIEAMSPRGQRWEVGLADTCISLCVGVWGGVGAEGACETARFRALCQVRVCAFVHVYVCMSHVDHVRSL